MNIGSLDWPTIASAAATVEAVVVLVGVWFAIRQLREANKARSLDAFQILSKDIKDQEGERKFIYSHCAKQDPKRMPKSQKSFISRLRCFLSRKRDQWKSRKRTMPTLLPNSYSLSDEEIEQVRSVCVMFDRMGVLVVEGLIPKDVAFSMYFDVVLRLWCLLQPFIMQERERRQNDLWLMYFERLSEECWKHWKKLFFSREWKHIKDLDHLFNYYPPSALVNESRGVEWLLKFVMRSKSL